MLRAVISPTYLSIHTDEITAINLSAGIGNKSINQDHHLAKTYTKRTAKVDRHAYLAPDVC